jgi:lipid-A-disaccharide synthase-like uncharacterized protein
MNVFLIYALGFLSQMLFFARSITQWVLSEKEGEVISPVMYWQISLGASILMLTYAIYRLDPVLFAAHSLGIFMYIRNILLYYGKTGFFSKLKKIPAMNRVIQKVAGNIKQ